VIFKLNKNSKHWKRFLIVITLLLLAYLSACLFLFFRQRELIYRPNSKLAMLPNASAFKLPYQDIWIPIAHAQSPLHAWWIPAPSRQEKFSLLPNEPMNILTALKTMLYLCGVGRNMGDYNYLARVSAFRQLGFSVLVFDYRGYGLSKGAFPQELQVYEDSQVAWNYLRYTRRISSEQIVIYGESLGGAIALDLAIKHPDAGGKVRLPQWLR
jgi:hypothetical protein